MDSQLTILIPVFNEERALAGIIQRLRTIVPSLPLQSEILVVDDGSTDGSGKAVAGMDDVRLLQHRSNRGYGAALKTGIRHAEGDVIVILDADGTYPPEEIPGLVEHYQSGLADMVVGARIGPEVQIPLARRPAKWFINQLGTLVAGERVPDLNSGMRLFRRRVALEFFDLLPDGFSFTSTITLGMMQNGYLVEFVPIAYEKRTGHSKIRPISDTLGFIQLILRVALYFQPLKIFIPLSLLLFGLAAIWAWVSGQYFGGIADASTAVLIMSGLQVAVVGLLAELINARLPNRDRSGRRSDEL
jgi:glycosyltransferase involved in cell wall biosynthesis